MLSLLGAALGFGTSIIPSILDLFQQKQKDELPHRVWMCYLSRKKWKQRHCAIYETQDDDSDEET